MYLSTDVPRDIVVDFGKVISIASIDGLLVVNGKEHVLYLYRATSNHIEIKKRNRNGDERCGVYVYS